MEMELMKKDTNAPNRRQYNAGAGKDIAMTLRERGGRIKMFP